MKTSTIGAGVMAVGVLAGCTTLGTPSPEQITCLQPNRRVVIEIGGTQLPPPPKPKPDAKPDAKPAAPKPVPVMLTGLVQGNSAFDPGSAVLKAGGKEEVDEFLKTQVKGKLPTTVDSVVISGHSDRFEAREGDNALSESRAKSVKEYMESKGIDSKLMFWQGLGSKVPVPVTKFCEP